MSDEYPLVTIKGHEDAGVLVFMDDGDGTGPLTTEEDFAAFVPGYAHVFADGTIQRYGTVIAQKSDLVYLGPVVEGEAIEPKALPRVTK